MLLSGGSQMTSTDEAARIAKVYAAYANSPEVQARWASDNAGNRAILAERKRAIRQLLQRSGHTAWSGARVLEIGCGVGDVLASLADVGVDAHALWGVDLLQNRLRIAMTRNPGLHFASANGTTLPFPDGRFDLVLFFTVFSSVLDEQTSVEMANEAQRVLRVGGAVLWYDVRYDNPGNKHIRAVPLAAIQRLFPKLHLDLRTITVVPPLIRRLGPATPLLYPLLTAVPLLRTHYIGLLSKPKL